MKVVEFDVTSHSYNVITLAEVKLTAPSHIIYWIHYDLSDMSRFKEVTDYLQLPETVVDLCQSKDTLPYLNDEDNAVTMEFQCLMSTHRGQGKDEDVENLIFHLTNKFCFTASKRQIPSVTAFEEYYPKSLRYARTPCFVVFLILDNEINDYGQLLYDYELEIEKLDAKVANNEHGMYKRVAVVKKQLMKLKRYAVATREILMRISGRKINVISDACRVSLNNLFNQSQMIFNEIDSLRDMLNGLLNQIDYALMHKMNEVMKVLTAFAAIFLPLSLITGIYGMNFRYMPELEWHYGYFMVLGLILFCGLLLMYYFKKKDWF